MNMKLLVCVAAATLGLGACDSQPATSVAPDSTAPAASAAASNAPASATTAPAPSEAQVLTSRDNAISLSVKGNFQDQSSNADLLPEGSSAENITLLQQDAVSDITAYVENLGKPKKSAKEYYANLKQQLEKATGLTDVKIGIATENRMDYSFTQENGLKENCIAIYSPESLYNVCASSSTASDDQLAAVLKDVKLVKPIQ